MSGNRPQSQAATQSWFAGALMVGLWMFFRYGLWDSPEAGDIQHYFAAADAAFDRRIPYLEEPFECPPGVFVLACLLRLFTDNLATFTELFSGLCLAIDACTILMLRSLVETCSEEAQNVRATPALSSSAVDALRALCSPRNLATTIYIVITALLGNLLTQRYEMILGALLMLWLIALRRRRVTASIVVLAVAIWFKLSVALLLPLHFMHLFHLVGAPAHDSRPGARLGAAWGWVRGDGRRYLLVLGGSLAALFLPFIAVSRGRLFAVFAYHNERGLHVDSTYAGLAIVLDPYTASVQPHNGTFYIASPYSGAMLAVALVLLVVLPLAVGLLYGLLRPVLNAESKAGVDDWLVRGTALCLLFILFSVQMFSSLLLLWLAPVVALLAIAPQERQRGLAVSAVAVYGLTTLILIVFYVLLVQAAPFTGSLLVIRSVLVMAMAGSLALVFLRTGPWLSSKQRLKGEPSGQSALPALAPLLPSSRAERWILLAFGFAVVMALFVRLRNIPGLQGDEAWVYLRTLDILGGARPTDGLTNYTSSLHHYLMAQWMQFFDQGVFALRSFSAFCTVVSALATVSLCRLLLPRFGMHFWTSAVVISSPVFIIYGRWAIEMTSIVPVLCLGGVSLIAYAARAEAGGSLPIGTRAVAGGAMLGLAAYSHALALLYPLSLGIASCIVYRQKAAKSRVLWSALGGFTLGFAPRIVGLLHWSDGRTGDGPAGANAQWEDLTVFWQTARGVLDGHGIYQGFAGEQLVVVLPYTTVAGLVAVAAYLVLVKKKEAPLLLLGYTVLIQCVVLFFITPTFLIRDFWPVVVCALLCTVTFAMAAVEARGQDAAMWGRRICAGFVVLNSFYLVVNYYVALSRSGGRSSVYLSGRGFQATSNHFIDSEPLYNQLVARGVRHVLADPFIMWPLKAYDHGSGRLVFTWLGFPDIPEQSNHRMRQLHTAVVYYNGVNVAARFAADYRGIDQFHVGDVLFRRDQSFDPHFIVYCSEPGAASAKGWQ